MSEKNIQEQINEINNKLDRVLEFVEHQYGKREEFDDLVADLSIVAKDAFSSTVTALDKAGVELDTCRTAVTDHQVDQECRNLQ